MLSEVQKLRARAVDDFRAEEYETYKQALSDYEKSQKRQKLKGLVVMGVLALVVSSFIVGIAYITAKTSSSVCQLLEADCNGLQR
jgi:hypothetical protein